MATASEAAKAQAQTSADTNLRSTFQGPKLELTIEELKERTRGIRDDQVIKFKRRIRKWTQEKIDPSKYSYLEFVGFNPEIIRNAFIAMGLYYSMTFDQLIEDIMTIIAMNLYMGNMLEKNRKRRSDEAKKVIAEMAQKYNLKYGQTSTGLDPHVITVPRVAAAFPILTVRMFHVLKPNTLLGMPFLSMSVPDAMRTSVFCSFLHVKLAHRTRLFLMKVVACYSCDQSVIFSSDPKTRKPTLEAPDAYSRQWTYIQASASSPAEDMYVMHDTLVEFGVPDKYSTFKPLVENLDQLTGLTDIIPTEFEYKKDLDDFRRECDIERTRRRTEEDRILTEREAQKRAEEEAEGQRSQGGRQGGSSPLVMPRSQPQTGQPPRQRSRQMPSFQMPEEPPEVPETATGETVSGFTQPDTTQGGSDEEELYD
jgi:hypothetical protein